MEKKQSVSTQYVLITPERKWNELKLGEVWKYRDLILLLTRKTFVVRYKQTVLGPLWALIHPFLSSVVLTIVFGRIVRVDTGGIPHILFYLCSNGLWVFFAECLRSSARTFTGNAGLFGKVYFPRLTVPVSNMLVALIGYGLQLLMLGGFLVYYIAGGTIRPLYAGWIALPFLLLLIGIQGMSVGILISSLTTKYRDLTMLVDYGVQLWMYISAVVYPVSQLSDGILRTLVLLNPLTASIECYRMLMLGKGTFAPGFLIFDAVFTLVAAVISIGVFNHVEKTFMDTV